MSKTAKLVIYTLFVEAIILLCIYQMQDLWLAIKDADAKYSHTYYAK